MLDRLEFLLSEGLAAFRRNILMMLAAVSTAAVALFVIGGMGYSYLKLRAYTETLSSRFTMRAFVKDGTGLDGIKKTAASLRAISGVAEVNWIPKDTAWKKAKLNNPEFADIPNPYPDAFKIRIANLDRTNEVVSAIKALPLISSKEGVQYLAEEQQLLAQAKSFIQWIGTAIGGLCLLTAAVLIYNTIRLTVVARRRELRVMQLVGASFATIRIPFLIEGAIQGLIAGMLATTLLFVANLLVGQMLMSYSSLGQPGAFPLSSSLALMCAAGVGFGVLCSLAAVRDPLKLGGSAA